MAGVMTGLPCLWLLPATLRGKSSILDVPLEFTEVRTHSFGGSHVLWRVLRYVLPYELAVCSWTGFSTSLGPTSLPPSLNQRIVALGGLRGPSQL